VEGSSTSWYVLVRKGAGTDLCVSKESKMLSQLSSRRAIVKRREKKKRRDRRKIREKETVCVSENGNE